MHVTVKQILVLLCLSSNCAVSQARPNLDPDHSRKRHVWNCLLHPVCCIQKQLSEGSGHESESDTVSVSRSRYRENMTI